MIVRACSVDVTYHQPGILRASMFDKSGHAFIVYRGLVLRMAHMNPISAFVLDAISAKECQTKT